MIYEEPDFIETLKHSSSLNALDDVAKNINKMRHKVEKADAYKQMQLESKNGLTSNLNVIVSHNQTEFLKAVSENLNPIQLRTKAKLIQRQRRIKLLEPLVQPIMVLKPKLSITGLIEHKKIKEIAEMHQSEPLRHLMANTTTGQHLNMSFSQYQEQKKGLETTNFSKLLEKKKNELVKTDKSHSGEHFSNVKLPKIAKTTVFQKSSTQKTGLLLNTTKDEFENLIGHKIKIRYDVIKHKAAVENKLSDSDRFNLEYFRYIK